MVSTEKGSPSETTPSMERGGIPDHSVLGFYEPLASYYHMIFEDWDRAVNAAGVEALSRDISEVLAGDSCWSNFP